MIEKDYKDINFNVYIDDEKHPNYGKRINVFELFKKQFMFLIPLYGFYWLYLCYKKVGTNTEIYAYTWIFILGSIIQAVSLVILFLLPLIF